METKQTEWLSRNGPKLLSELIRFDTSNPPGNEAKLARFVCEWLDKLGLSCELVGPNPERESAIMVWRGTESDNGIILMSHLDVVPAVGRDWTYPPFSGQIADGYVWGRGAIDAKGVLAAQMLAVAMLKREGFKPRRTISMIAAADEEAGGNLGMRWLVENRPDLFEGAAFAINEGGGFSLALPKVTLFFLQTAEKGNCWLRLVAEGSGGHGSLKIEDSPVTKIIKATNALTKASMGIKVPKTTINSILAIIKYGGLFSVIIPIRRLLPKLKDFSVAKAVGNLRSLPKQTGSSFTILRHLFTHSVNVTGLKGYEKPNVIPDRAEATVDLRVLPGTKPETIIKAVQAITSAWDVKVEIIEVQEGFEFTPDKGFVNVLRDVLKEEEPRAELAPYMLPGSSDAKFLVRRGIKVYGFFPMRPKGSLRELGSMIHGKNERLEVEELLFAAKIYYKLLKRAGTQDV